MIIWVLSNRPSLMLSEDYKIRIKNRFERCRNSWQYRLAYIVIEFHNNFSPPTLTFYEIFTLKLAGECSNKRWNIIYAAYSHHSVRTRMYFRLSVLSPSKSIVHGTEDENLLPPIALGCFKSSCSHLSSGGVWPLDCIL